MHCNRKICNWGSSVIESVFVIFKYLFFTIQLEILFGYRLIIRKSSPFLLLLCAKGLAWRLSGISVPGPWCSFKFLEILFLSIERKNSFWWVILGVKFIALQFYLNSNSVPEFKLRLFSLDFSNLEHNGLLHFLYLCSSFLSLVIQGPIGNIVLSIDYRRKLNIVISTETENYLI